MRTPQVTPPDLNLFKREKSIYYFACQSSHQGRPSGVAGPRSSSPPTRLRPSGLQPRRWLFLCLCRGLRRLWGHMGSNCGVLWKEMVLVLRFWQRSQLCYLPVPEPATGQGPWSELWARPR